MGRKPKLLVTGRGSLINDLLFTLHSCPYPNIHGLPAVPIVYRS